MVSKLMLEISEVKAQEMLGLFIPKNIVYSGSKSNVCMTMIHGRILYRNGEFNIGESVEDIYARCGEIVRRIIG